MKALWTILLSLALAWGAGAFAVPPVGPMAKASPCTHCDCGCVGCCVGETPASPQPAPAAPAPPPTPAHDLALLGFTARPVSLPATLDPEAAAARALDPHLPAVPLRTRHCCLLI